MIDLDPFKTKGLDTDYILVDIQNVQDYIDQLDVVDVVHLPTVVPPWKKCLLGWKVPPDHPRPWSVMGENGLLVASHKSAVGDGWWVLMGLYNSRLAGYTRGTEREPLLGISFHYVPLKGVIQKFEGEERLRLLNEVATVWNLDLHLDPEVDSKPGYVAMHVANTDVVERFKRADPKNGEKDFLFVFESIGNCAQQRALFAFCFAHCKNVVQRKQSLSRAERRRLDRSKVTSQREFYYLDVRPVKRILETEGQIASTGTKQALHICRGHFKDFSGGKGLFGQHKGMYWWDQQVRGDVRRGVAEKGYNVKTKP